MTSDAATAPQPGTQSAENAEGLEYYVSLPAGAPPPGGWPVLVFLHGLGEASQNFVDGQWVAQDLARIQAHGSPPHLCQAKPGEARGLFESFLVVSPQFPFVPTEAQRAAGKAGRQWQWRDSVDSVGRMVGEVAARLGGNPNRIAATGFSRGGTGAVALATEPTVLHIAKLVLVDTESGLTELPDVPTWVQYAGPRTFAAIARRHDDWLKGVVSGVWQGAPPGGPRPPGNRLFTNLDLNGSSETEVHREACRRAYSDARVYEWLAE